MKIKVMYRTQCLAAYLGYGPDFDVENISEPTLIISISSTDDQIPLILKSGENKIMAISLIADIGIFDSGLSRETLGALINVAVLMLHIAGGCIVASVACAVWDSNKI